MRRTSSVSLMLLASCGGAKYGSTLQSMLQARTSAGPVVGTIQRADLEAGSVVLDRVLYWVTGAGPVERSQLGVAVSGNALCATLAGTVGFIGTRDSLEDERKNQQDDEDDRKAATTAFEISVYPTLPTSDAWPMTHNALKVEYTRVPPPGTGVRITNDRFTMTACGELPAVRAEDNFLVLGFWHPTDGKSVAVWRIEPGSGGSATGATGTTGTTGTTSTSSTDTPRQGAQPAAGTADLLGTLRADGRFTVFLQLVDDTDLATQLGSGDHTMFAFLDSAVSGKGGIQAFASLRANRKKLTDYLSRLVVPGVVTEDQLRSSASLKSLNGNLKVKVNGGKILVEDAEIVFPPLAATNGLIFTFLIK